MAGLQSIWLARRLKPWLVTIDGLQWLMVASHGLRVQTRKLTAENQHSRINLYHRSNPTRKIVMTLFMNQHQKSEKALRETQTLRAGCSKVEPKNFAWLQTPSWGRRTAKISGVAGPLAARGGGQICHPFVFVLGFGNCESLFKAQVSHNVYSNINILVSSQHNSMLVQWICF